MADQVQRSDAGQHQQEEHAAPAKAVGQQAQRQPHQRAGQYRGRGQQAELGFVELEKVLDRHPEHGKHHPDHETDSEGQCAHAQHQALSYTGLGHDALQSVSHGCRLERPTPQKLDPYQRSPWGHRPMLARSTSKEVVLQRLETLGLSGAWAFLPRFLLTGISRQLFRGSAPGIGGKTCSGALYALFS
ncbi:hypothetical protein D3C85_1172790 [compost metagenome]